MADDVMITRQLVDVDRLGEGDFVHPLDATEHGYSGFSPESDREQYTVAGVTGGSANTSDQPDLAAKKRAEANTAALKGAGK